MANSPGKIHWIPAALYKHRAFLAYVKVNALLHDADKAGEDFLIWSLTKKSPNGYPGHNVDRHHRQDILDRHTLGKPVHSNFAVSFPAQGVACEPHLLRSEFVTHLLYQRKQNQPFIDRLKESRQERFERLAKSLKEKNPFLQGDYTDLLDIPDFNDLKKEFAQVPAEQRRWFGPSRPGHSLYDFFLWHHHHATGIKTATTAPTALQLFTAGTGGCDGIDTGYETEAEERDKIQHHVPNTGGNRFLLATPFGYERQLCVRAAREACEAQNLADQLDAFASALSNHTDPFDLLPALEEAIRNGFDQSVIRTGRPINDVTLADHSISSAALAAAQAARIVLETADPRAAEASYFYALPVRAKKRPDRSQWPVTRFALFSCAVNRDRLDDMALELKDIAAIRSATDALLQSFVEHFSCKLPVGGAVYQDQFGAHLVVPVLGDPDRRWIAEPHEQNVGVAPPGQIPWMQVMPTEAVPDQTQFRKWLFDEARSAITAIKDLGFGHELLVGLRYAVIEDHLNRLGEAIAWTRQVSHWDVGMSTQSAEEAVHEVFFNPGALTGPSDDKPDRRDICPVCRLRFPDTKQPAHTEGFAGKKKSAGKKCRICRERLNKERVAKGETGVIEAIAKRNPDRRVALVSLSFNLDEWLSAPSNAGVFGFGENAGRKKWLRISANQRQNSFGRLRRIWRTTETFLMQIRNEIGAITAVEGGAPFPVRTILTAPQDLQLIVPAHRVKAIIDYVVAAFFEQFGRVPGRIPFHISALAFAFRVPIYLVLEAARRLKEMALTTEPHPVALQRGGRTGSYPCFQWTRTLGNLTLGDRNFQSEAPIPYQQDYQPEGCAMGGQDRFHVNLQRVNQTPEITDWGFAGECPEKESTDALMVLNRICLAEIGSGLSLNELGMASEQLSPIRCHDLPLEHWASLNDLLRREKRISNTQKRRLRFVQAKRQRLWQPADVAQIDLKREEACALLWREPRRIGPLTWGKLHPFEQTVLTDACLNGMIYLAQFIEKRFQPNHSKE